MIRREDLREAIAECEGQRNPNANTCIKLAAYHIIMDHLQEDNDVVLPKMVSFPANSYATLPKSDVIEYKNNTEFAESINGMHVNDLISIMDELMSTLQIVNPRLYNSVMRRVTE